METSTRMPEWVLVFISLLPLLYLALTWTGLPATVPIHFNSTGTPDGFAARQTFAFIVVLFTGVSYGLFRVLPALDPTGKLTPAVYDRIRFTVTLFMTGIAMMMVVSTQPGRASLVMGNMMLPFVSLLLAAVGNLMLTIPQNYLVGIKTPWALASETNWRKTHRLAGWLWVGGGLLAFVGTLLLPVPAKMPLFLAIVGVMVVVPYGYSYRLFKQGVFAIALVLIVSGQACAQTETPMSFAITQPAGSSLTLDGTLTMPANASKKVPVVLLIAGSGPTDRNGNSSAPGFQQMNMYHQLADSLAKRGVAVLRYDKRGSGTNALLYAARLGKTPPDFNHGVADAVGFVRQLQADNRFSSVTVAGHSEGSLVGMLAAAQTGASRFVSIAGAGQNITDIIKTQFASGGVQGELLAAATRDLDSLKAGQVVRKPPAMLASFFSPAAQPYLISWMQYDPAKEIKAVKGPVLIIQGRRDIQVAVGEAERLKTARPDARLVFFDTMSHIMKEAPADRAANIATYSDPKLTILPAVVDAIAAFVKGK